jgi:hypothetical protein
MIEKGEFASVTELAKAKKVNQSYAYRVLRLTYLAPAVIVDLLNGRHSHLMLKQLMKPLPVTWSTQLKMLNIHRNTWSSF